jgi:hypothetical protein
MRGAQISVAPEDQEASVNDLRLPAINVARLTLSRLSRLRADRYCAAIASARVGRRSREPEEFIPASHGGVKLDRR